MKITTPEKLKADDLQRMAPQVDSLTNRFGKIRLVIDASEFNVWENVAAFENHAKFKKKHQQKVDRIGIIVTDN